jgi:hypothetical protein
MITEINNLYLSGLSESLIIAKLKVKSKKRPLFLNIIWKKRSAKAVRDLRNKYFLISTPTCLKVKWKKYKCLVWKLTKLQKIDTLENFSKRGFRDYHLDHVISIWTGFKENIDPKVIANIENLRFIPYRENMSKGRRSFSIV